jgi:maleylpyruvate isomerase
LDARLVGLRDEQARAPSLLPGWSVGHLLTHIARNGDSVVWRLEGAAQGELRDQYPGGFEQRQSDIEGGAGRSAEELVKDVAQSSSAVARAMAELPEAAWDAPSRTSLGLVETSRDAVFARWREVVVHHGDLGPGFGKLALPADLVDAWLPRELPQLGSRTDAAALLTWIIGRGEAPPLAPWHVPELRAP